MYILSFVCMFRKWASPHCQLCLSVMLLKFVFLRVWCPTLKNYTSGNTSQECFHFMRVREWTPRRLTIEKKRGDVIIFHLVPCCRHVLPKLWFWFTIAVLFCDSFPDVAFLCNSRPCIHGSTTINVVGPGSGDWSMGFVLNSCGFQRTLPAASWYINATGCVAVTNSLSERFVSALFSGRSHNSLHD
jgi:hypothetical protein